LSRPIPTFQGVRIDGDAKPESHLERYCPHDAWSVTIAAITDAASSVIVRDGGYQNILHVMLL
jgi:hypothetical protein